MSRYLIAVLAVFLGTQMSGVARAATVQYDLTLTPTVGTIGGSGYFDVVAPVNEPGSNALTYFSVTLDGQDFTLGNDPATATATFSSTGLLRGINYAGALVSTLGGGFNLDILATDLNGLLTYNFFDIGTNATIASGTISATVDAPSATPLPPAVVLFATGLLGLGLLVRRQKKSAVYGLKTA